MKNKGVINLLISLFVAVVLLNSCKDDYIYDDQEPDFLSGSIYEYLETDGNFTYYKRLIDDLGRKDYLNLTGSITLFVANDSAFNEFFKNNRWNVYSYEQLTENQKKMLFNYSVIRNAYTLEKLSNYYDGNYYEGLAMRRYTSHTALDSISFVSEFPTVKYNKKNNYWEPYRGRGLYLMKDNSDVPFVFFSPQFMQKSGITDADFSFLSGGRSREVDDFFVFNHKVIKKDHVCKNGYVNVLESVLIPPVNMAEYIATNEQTKIFSSLLERFSAPYYDATTTALYKQLYPTFTDSIFNKKYFATNGGETVDPNKRTVPYVLPYNPGWNGYTITSGSSVYSDMAAMFVPTDETMKAYLNNDPTGSLIKERYGEWDSIPDDIISAFLSRHMRMSLIESVPSRFSAMVDAQNYQLPVSTSDIVTEYNYTAVNGQIYFTNKVYTPVDFISVYAPILLTEGTRIIDWAINRTESATDGTVFAFYKLYLNSLAANYSLFIPTDDYLDRYIDPVAFGQTTPAILKYWYNTETEQVNANIHTYINGVVGDSIDVITNATFLQNRLWKLLDSHIVIGNTNTDGYYITKANDIIKLSNGGQQVQGGLDIEEGGQAGVTRTFPQQNGTTYLLDAPIQSALRSVYATLTDSTKPLYSDFLDLLDGVPSDYATEIPPIFTARGINYCVSFFNSYHYTIYVPTNDAVQTAIRNGKIKTWTAINSLTGDERKQATRDMVRFLRYHFHDRAVFVGQVETGKYESSTIRLDGEPETDFNTPINKYYKLDVSEDAGTIKLTTENGTTAKVLKTEGYYNQIAKDYVFNSSTHTSTSFKGIDGTGATSAANFTTSRVNSSSSAVIHLIDNVLTFK